MVKTINPNKHETESKLSKFNLSFEFDRTWQEVKKEVQLRTFK